MLRSQTPAGITQEIWALLCACQLSCAARARAAATGGHDPDRISYTVTLRAIRRAIITPAPPGSITAEALHALLPPRRRRSYPRLTPAGMAMALRMLQRPSYQLERLESGPVVRPGGQQRARHARARTGSRLRTTLLRPAV